MESPYTLIDKSHPREIPDGESARTRITRRLPRRSSRSQRRDTQTLVLERYLLLERLGAGGFGVVWRARDERLQREVAVKRIELGPEVEVERAAREALASARLSHPAIVALYEARAVEEENAYYLISELVEGDTLAQLIAQDVLEDEEVLEIGLALVEALAHAHARGVIHRDIKPQNVLVPTPPEGRAAATQGSPSAAKLTDFGGASLLGEDALTRTGDVLGTLAYMAPEQSEGQEVGPPSDLYSLALVLYEALSGINPVRGATPAATARRIGGPLESLQRQRRDLPRELTRALDIALSPESHRRGSLEELRTALEDVLDGVVPTRRAPVRATAVQRRPRSPAPLAARIPAVETPAGVEQQEQQMQPPARIAIPRAIWIACALAGLAWQVSVGHAGVALLMLVGLLPLFLLPTEQGSSRIGLGWLSCVLAPVLGLAGLAGAYPSLAGQAAAWRQRAVLGALGYWWLTLAEPLLGRHLWLGDPSALPARGAWESSIETAASHVISPALSLGVLLGALLWACGAVALPWLVRGRHAPLDFVAVVLWSAALAASAPALDAGLSAHAAHPSPRGAVLGAILGALFALAARALRGPV